MKKVFHLVLIPVFSLAFLALIPKNCPAPVVGWDKAFNYQYVQPQKQAKKKFYKYKAPRYTKQKMKKRYPTQNKVYKAKKPLKNSYKNAYRGGKRTSKKYRGR